MSHPTITQNGAVLHAQRRQVEGNVGAAELHLTDAEIAEIEGRNIYEPKVVTAA